ncbi:SUR7-domain-containing protein [Microthyrium microscopicum]|uniref:SUR7-domain-containing protein n=1 Tax=Microthyrium microscopicum TaxID=703497 RepID=A0A6A6UT40_9PEZI|nr:SUR7-domain-containing protein [Microthyrium microscopicum]
MARPILGLISLVFLAGAILFQFFIILSGGVHSSPETKIYFLQADTTGMAAPNPARWTYWSLCGVDGNVNANCGSPVPAFPFDPANRRNFGSSAGVPDAFLTGSKWWYLSRFAWVLFLIALVFSVGAFLLSGLALCTRIGAWISSVLVSFALFWQTVAAALMTAWTVEARNVFRQNEHDASLGKYAYGFTWGAVALLFLSMITFCLAGGSNRKQANTYETSKRSSSRGRSGFFRRRRTSVRKEYV